MDTPMVLSPRGLDFIKAREGFSGRAYADGAGLATIGYGHKLRPGEAYPDGITEANALLLLVQDIAAATAAVSRLVTVELGQAQFDALVSFAFNVGTGAFAGSTLLRLVNAADAAKAALQFPRWDKQRRGTMLIASPGLLARRLAEQALFAGGTYA